MDWTAPLSVLFPSVQGAVTYALWRRPVPMTGREVHRVSGTGSYTGTLAALARLVDQGLVDARHAGQASEYSLNTEHVLYPVLDAALVAFNPRERFEQGLRDLMREHFPGGGDGASLVIFGSYARGEARTGSDIDLLLVLPVGTSAQAVERVVSDLEQRGRRWSGNAVQVYAISLNDLQHAVTVRDPIVDSWEREARTVIGTDVQRLLQKPARAPR